MDFLPRWLRGARPEPRLRCARAVWRRGVAELARRTGGSRESGAFLLGAPNAKCRRIETFLFYDDLDPHCFRHGIVEFDGRKLGELWTHCRRYGLTVVADVHVHPGDCHQSPSDQHNPMIPEVGHMALILPYFAKRDTSPGKIGIYEYLGGRRWADHSVSGSAAMRVTRWP
jgi:hypothetical protein